MKKTCDRCKALRHDRGPIWSCELGYEMDFKTLKPLEECPKPLTNMAIINANKKGKKI